MCAVSALVTLDADLQIPAGRSGETARQDGRGYDYVGSIREKRGDMIVAARRLARDELASRTPSPASG
jgi:hypothetical protein